MSGADVEVGEHCANCEREIEKRETVLLIKRRRSLCPLL
jgi:hypothetical protein